jgi:hypothetical protein
MIFLRRNGGMENGPVAVMFSAADESAAGSAPTMVP